VPTLSSYSNVDNTCYLVLRKKGWRFWVTKKRNHPEAFWAEKNGWDLCANSPIELLGLVALYEWKRPKSYKEYWWLENGPQLISKLPTKAPRYQPVGERNRS
jgi:hypothetical protein